MQAEISLCKVYKRPGVDDHPSLPRTLPTRASSSRTHDNKQYQDAAQHHAIEKFHVFGDQTALQQPSEKISETISADSTTEDVGTALGLSNQNPYIQLSPITTMLPPPLDCSTIYNVPNPNLVMTSPNTIDDLHRLISYQQASANQPHQLFPNHNNPSINLNSMQLPPSNLLPPVQHSQSLTLAVLPAGSIPNAYSDRLWEWGNEATGSKDYGAPFK